MLLTNTYYSCVTGICLWRYVNKTTQPQRQARSGRVSTALNNAIETIEDVIYMTNRLQHSVTNKCERHLQTSYCQQENVTSIVSPHSHQSLFTIIVRSREHRRYLEEMHRKLYRAECHLYWSRRECPLGRRLRRLINQIHSMELFICQALGDQAQAICTEDTSVLTTQYHDASEQALLNLEMLRRMVADWGIIRQLLHHIADQY